jgi:hypothetical protein
MAGCLCPLNPTKRTFPCCFALVRVFENTVARIDQFWVIVVNDLVDLPDIEVIGLSRLSGASSMRIRSFPIRMRGDGAHDDDVVSFSFDANAKLLFAEAFVKLPGIVEDIDAVVDGFGDHVVHLSLIRNSAEMEAADAHDGAFEAGPAERASLRLEAAEGS